MTHFYSIYFVKPVFSTLRSSIVIDIEKKSPNKYPPGNWLKRISAGAQWKRFLLSCNRIERLTRALLVNVTIHIIHRVIVSLCFIFQNPCFLESVRKSNTNGWKRNNFCFFPPRSVVDCVLCVSYTLPANSINWADFTKSADEIRCQVTTKKGDI